MRKVPSLDGYFIGEYLKIQHGPVECLTTGMLDTGANVSIVSHEIASLLKLKPSGAYPLETANGAIFVKGVTVDSLVIGETTKENVLLLVHDMKLPFPAQMAIGLDLYEP